MRLVYATVVDITAIPVVAVPAAVGKLLTSKQVHCPTPGVLLHKV